MTIFVLIPVRPETLSRQLMIKDKIGNYLPFLYLSIPCNWSHAISLYIRMYLNVIHSVSRLKNTLLLIDLS